METKVEYVNIADITPAPYNPRKLSEEQFTELQKSIGEIGFVVPIIINRKNGIIIAGHQRSKSARAVGYTEVPALYVKDIVQGDEIKFNQMHNGVEEKTFEKVQLQGEYEKETFLMIEPKNFVMLDKNLAMPCVKEICNLLLKYGNVMSCVVCQNKVVFATEYVYACKMLNMPVNTYICEDSKLEAIKHYFIQDYGEYSYENIERNTFVQGLAQLHRSFDKKEGKKSFTSQLYTKLVFPYLADHSEVKDILDFGCGKAAYINSLKQKYDAMGVEFFNNNGSSIIVSKGHEMIDALIEKIKKKPKFDVVICDSVLNSVDSVEAEAAVMDCLNLFTDKKMFISGRLADSLKERNSRKSTAIKNHIHYTDKDGLTATYRQGKWFFQKFHTKEQVYALIERHGFKVVKYTIANTSFQVECEKVHDMNKEDYIRAIDFEFNLPLPNGQSYNRHEDVKKALNLV